jgi:hypothetical protein
MWIRILLLTLMRIWIRILLLTLKRIRIQLPKIMWVRIRNTGLVIAKLCWETATTVALFKVDIPVLLEKQVKTDL